MKKIIAYRQGQDWIVNINGYLKQLHYSIKTKKEVKEWFEERQNNREYEDFILEFA